MKENNWANGFRGLSSKWHCKGMAAGTAERSHLNPQIGDRKGTQNRQSFEISKLNPMTYSVQ